VRLGVQLALGAGAVVPIHAVAVRIVVAGVNAVIWIGEDMEFKGTGSTQAASWRTDFHTRSRIKRRSVGR
jgi:hypothetical protein